MPTPCPHCGRQPKIETCEPWPRNAGSVPWYVGCYFSGTPEHFIGVNGDTKAEALEEWERETAKHKRACDTCAGVDECAPDCDQRRFDNPID